ncbi:DinB family protein [Paenarthrobacter sp. PH39-S1]|uniref:DinB family protein n=1 Tax=Paenarthrobacter sp. PH39-S1 TaxID=3046204 RepID=UPI0024B979C9|nr:DinB family protein [Paenarthrobacter sp. PH39-S1]MDJ0355959.1 DinB family protein [Paenarthrobacter sp. PH39-S1]
MDNRLEDIVAGYERACGELTEYLLAADRADLRRGSSGTRWTNEELLFHMVFGYMVVRTLLTMVRLMGRLPRWWGRGFAAVLNAGTTPFDAANYWGSRAAALVYNRYRMGRKLEKTTQALARRLRRETPASLALSMAFPARWDPFFAPEMTLADLYAYPTLHFSFHAAQLTLDQHGACAPGGPPA